MHAVRGEPHGHQIATPTPFTDRSDAELGWRNNDGRARGAGAAGARAGVGVGVTGVFGDVRYTMPVPVRGLSLAAAAGTASADALLEIVVRDGFAGEREGKATPSRGGALVAMAMGRAVACGCRSPCDGTRRRLDGVLEVPLLLLPPPLAERAVRVSADGMRRLPCVCGRRSGRGTVVLRGVESAGDGSPLDGESMQMTFGLSWSTATRSSLAGVFFEPYIEPRSWGGKSAGVTGVTRLAVEEDVDGVLKPISSPSCMCPSECVFSAVVSIPRRFSDAGADR